LRDASCADARHVVALTGSDEVNLAVCQMAKKAFGVPETIARVINPKNEAIMKRLGIDATISTTSMAAETIEKALPARGMRLSPIFSQGDVDLAEIELAPSSPVVGKTVAELVLPEDCLLIALIRGGLVHFPRGRSVFMDGDRVFALARKDAAESLRAALLGGAR
jgi:trk system potassium uptake protein TrkA